MQGLIDFIKRISRDKQSSIQPDTLLFREKILDSINILDLLGYVEKRISRRLKDEEVIMPNFESARKIAETFFKDSQ